MARLQFQDEYLIETQISSNDVETVLSGSLPDFVTSGSPIGIDVDTLKLYLNDSSDLSPDINIIHQRKASGNSFKSTGTNQEYHMGLFSPKSSWNFDANATTLALPLWLLFQSGVVQESTVPNRAKRIIPYSSSAIEVYASIGRNLGTESQVIDACIVKSLSLSAKENSVLTCSVNFLGGGYRNDVDGSTWNSASTLRAPLLWQDASVTLRYNTTSGVKLDITDFNLNISNNLRIKYWDAQTVSKFFLGIFNASGSMKVARDITNYAGNQIINDMLDTSGDIGVDRPMFIMWSKIKVTGGDTLVDSSGVSSGAISFGVDDVSGFTSGDIIIIDNENANQEFGMISSILINQITLEDKFTYTHAEGVTVKEADRDFFGIKLNIRFNGAPTAGDDELITEASFTCVDDGTHKPIMIGLIDNVNRGIS